MAELFDKVRKRREDQNMGNAKHAGGGVNRTTIAVIMGWCLVVTAFQGVRLFEHVSELHLPSLFSPVLLLNQFVQYIAGSRRRPQCQQSTANEPQ